MYRIVKSPPGYGLMPEMLVSRGFTSGMGGYEALQMANASQDVIAQESLNAAIDRIFADRGTILWYSDNRGNIFDFSHRDD